LPPCEGSLACPSGERYTPVLLTFARQAQGFKPFTAAEVKALREKKLTPQQVLEERKKLGLK